MRVSVKYRNCLRLPVQVCVNIGLLDRSISTTMRSESSSQKVTLKDLTSETLEDEEVIVALPQKGVELGEKITQKTNEIEILPVREIVHPDTLETIGSVSADGTLWLEDSLEDLNIDREVFEKQVNRLKTEAQELCLRKMFGRQKKAYRNRKVILTVGNDSTPQDIMAAIGSIKKNGPESITVLTEDEKTKRPPISDLVDGFLVVNT